MLIVSYALHCVDDCSFVFYHFLTLWHTVLLAVFAISSDGFIGVMAL